MNSGVTKAMLIFIDSTLEAFTIILIQNQASSNSSEAMEKQVPLGDHFHIKDQSQNRRINEICMHMTLMDCGYENPLCSFPNPISLFKKQFAFKSLSVNLQVLK